jgi:hypothetical protein
MLPKPQFNASLSTDYEAADMRRQSLFERRSGVYLLTKGNSKAIIKQLIGFWARTRA